MTAFGKMSWDPSALERLGLPPAEYPVPIQAFANVMAAGGRLSVADLIAWTMEYLDAADEDRADCEALLLAIAERHAPADAPPQLWLESRSTYRWSLWLGPVDLTGEIVTIEQGERLLAAVQRAEPDRICACAYGAVSAGVSLLLRGYAQELEMGELPIDSFQAAVAHTKGWANLYAFFDGRTHVTWWPHGLGRNKDGSFAEGYGDRPMPNPIPAAWLAFFLDLDDRVRLAAKG